ncbi:class E vacuolar protein-sorting machinery protein HSE1-like [Euphorbia lathyris]|uniref:class E vacuolar protein-sorting machinery protein HSE1-like n=1 Tax=Euphorbia lathyris TaxID=212925 RepID=UPI0033134BC8
MNSSSYMDKQITELSSRDRSLLNDEDEGVDDQDHAFNFHPIRPLQSLSKSLDSAPLRGWSSMDQIDSAKLSGDRVGSSVDNELIPRIEQKLKEHADVLLHSMECLSARVSQIETRTRQVENSFDELKEAVDFNHGKISGKLMELENILMEVHHSVKDLRDKQEIAETQMLLAKLQVSKNDPQAEKHNSTVKQSSCTEAISSQQSNQQPSVPAVFPQFIPASSSGFTNLPPQNYPPTTPAATAQQFPMPSASQLPAATAPQLPSNLSQSIMPSFPQQESFYSIPVTTSAASHQPYMPPSHQSQAPPHSHQSQSQSPPQAHQHYQGPAHLPLNSQLTQLPPAPQHFPPVSPRADNYHSEELPYLPSHGIQKPSQPHERPPHQYFHMNPPQRSYDQPSNLRYPDSSSAILPAQALQPAGYANSMDYHYSSPKQSGGSAMNPFQPLSAPGTSGETGYSRLPTARALPHAIPTASSVDNRSSSSESGNRVPVDDVIDKVVAMGFRRDLVRATVNKLTENGQHVDLNIVLDKLMNNM